MVDERDVFDKVGRALAAFVKDNFELLEFDASERSIPHKMAECLQREFDDSTVDCEYNREGKGRDPKRIGKRKEINSNNRKQRRVFPDIVVHQRGTQERNVLVIEIKKSHPRRPHDNDIEKLKAFTRPKYSYQIGLFLVVGVGNGVKRKPFSGIQCFKCGNEVTKSIWTELEGIDAGGRVAA